MFKQEKNELISKSLHAVAGVAIIFSCVVACLMIIQYRQLTKIPLLEFQQIDVLKERFKQDPQNEQLSQRIRLLDFLSRRTYFSTQEQLAKGGYLLLGGLLVLFLSLGGAKVISGPIAPPVPQVTAQQGGREAERISIIVMGGLTLTIITLLFSVIRYPQWRSFFSSVPLAQPSAGTNPYALADFKKNWPNFRGPLANATSSDHLHIPKFDGPGQTGIIWKKTVPLPGFGSAIVWGDQLFVTGGNRQERALFSYQALTGELQWKTSTHGVLNASQLPKVAEDTGFAASTPATDGHRVYAIFATGELIATDLAGKKLWHKNLGTPENHYGYASSLLAFGNRLVVQFDGNQKQTLYLFAGASGKTIWKKERKSIISWSSPALIPWENDYLIVVLTSKMVEAYQFSTGKLLWETECLAGEVATSATYWEDVLLVASDNARAVGINLKDGTIRWKNESAVQPDVASPLAYQNMGFLFASSGSITCLDLKTGKILWEKDVAEGFYSSPVLINERIAIFDLTGTLLVIKPDSQGLIVESRSRLGDKVVATPAFKGKNMWIRGQTYLFRIQDKNQDN